MLKEKIAQIFTKVWHKTPMVLVDRKEIESKLAVVVNAVYEMKKHKEDLEYESYLYMWENSPESATSYLLKALGDSSGGVIPITWDLKDYDEEIQRNEFSAYTIDSETWELMQMVAEDSDGNEEGFNFYFSLLNEKTIVDMPRCMCFEVSSKTTIDGNCIDDNCDTWGTQYNCKAQRLYAFYITDIEKYAIVEVSYWVV